MLDKANSDNQMDQNKKYHHQWNDRLSSRVIVRFQLEKLSNGIIMCLASHSEQSGIMSGILFSGSARATQTTSSGLGLLRGTTSIRRFFARLSAT